MESLEEVKAVLKALIISNGQGMTFLKLENDYKAFTGNKLPYLRLGYRTLEKFLESLSDTVHLQRNLDDITVHSTFSRNSQHITQMIKAQKKPTRTRSRAFRNSNVIPAPIFSRTYNEQRSVPLYNNSKYPGNLSAPHNSFKNVSTSNPSSSTKKHHFHHYIHYVPDNKPNTTEEYGNVAKNNIRKPGDLLNNNGYRYEKDNKNKENFCNSQTHEINKKLQKGKYEDKTENLHLNANNKIQNRSSENEIKNLEENKLSKSFKELNLEKSVDKEEDTEISHKVEQSNTSSTSSSNIVQEINVRKIKTAETTNLIPPKMKIVQYNKNLKRYHNNLNVIREQTPNISSKNSELAIPRLNYDDEIFLLDYPLPRSDICTSIPKIKLPNQFKEGNQVIALFISEIHNPFRFWFNIATNPNEHPLDILMADIENYYGSLHPKELRMSKSHIYPGQACATIYQNLWHRAEILDFISSDEPGTNYVKVFFVDYGTVGKCETGNLKYLLKQFGELPRQAYRGTLSDIRPYIKWSRDAIKYLIEEVSDVLLQGKITYLEEDRNICHLRLLRLFTAEEELVWKGSKPRLINECLEINGFAKFSPHFYKSNNDVTIEQKHYYHEQQRFPSFEILEMGKYPTFKQILYKIETEEVDLEQKTFWLMQLENLSVPTRYDKC